jgi:septation ring formation regulator EzrA
MDKEFDAVQEQCPHLPINMTTANEHVPEIEQTMTIMKEHTRGLLNTLPFTEGLP